MPDFLNYGQQGANSPMLRWNAQQFSHGLPLGNLFPPSLDPYAYLLNVAYPPILPQQSTEQYIEDHDQPQNYIGLTLRRCIDGVPPGRMLASLALVPSGPYPSRHPFTPGPFSGGHGPPPPYHNPRNHGNIPQRANVPQTLSYDTAPPPPPEPPSHGSSYEPPGQLLTSKFLKINFGRNS